MDYEFQFDVDPATFRIVCQEWFLEDYKDMFVTVFYEDEDDFKIICWDGKGKYFTVSKSMLCDEDKDIAKNLILKHIKGVEE